MCYCRSNGRRRRKAPTWGSIPSPWCVTYHCSNGRRRRKAPTWGSIPSPWCVTVVAMGDGGGMLLPEGVSHHPEECSYLREYPITLMCYCRSNGRRRRKAPTWGSIPSPWCVTYHCSNGRRRRKAPTWGSIPSPWCVTVVAMGDGGGMLLPEGVSRHPDVLLL